MKKIIITVQLCVMVNLLNAQITTNEQPYSWNNPGGLITGKGDVIVLPVPDKVRIENGDKINDQEAGPLRFAYPVPVDFTTENSGSWQTLDDGGKLWVLNIKLPGALSANAIYDKFWLPDGAKFFVYSNETKQFIGAVTSEFLPGNSKEPSVFSTALIYGENVTFEYYQPASVKESAVISISRIDYGYRYVNNPYETTGLGASGACQVNINCSEGDNWQVEKHALARVTVVGPSGSGWCSCALINNTEADYTPYILTANHCLKGLDAVNNNNAGQWVFYWEYEYPGCANSGTPPNRTTTGGTVMANYSYSDFALLLLTQDPKNLAGVTPYYLGWDRTGNTGTGGVGIHHPSGDVKKIATYNQTPTSYSNYWRLNWIQTPNGYSVTEGGSSGSPLLNNDHHILGQLYGGSSINCSDPPADYAIYGKFNLSWDYLNNPKRRLKDWLDPNNTGVTVLDGLCTTVNFTNQTVSTNTTVLGCDIDVQSVTVTNSAKLTLDAVGKTVIGKNFKVQSGSELEIK
jgi:V8-like Glu-specific endopeptidase